MTLDFKSKSYRLLVAALFAAAMLIISVSIYKPAAKAEGTYIDGCEVFDLALMNVGGQPESAHGLYNGIYCSTFGDDHAVYEALLIREKNATFTLVDSYKCSDIDNCEFSHFADMAHETYTFSVHVEDAFVTSEYIVAFDVFDDYHMNEYSNHFTEVLYFVDDVHWVSSTNDSWTLDTVVKPDGKLLITYESHGLNASSHSITLDPNNVESYNDQYVYIADDIFELRLHSDGYIIFKGDKYYPEGMEKELHAIEFTSGNVIGNSSSNMYSRGIVASEGKVFIRGENGYSNSSLIRAGIDYNDSYVMHTGDDSYRYINIVNGICFYCVGNKYVQIETINGDHLWGAKGNCIVADTKYAFYTDSDNGLYRLDLETGNIEIVMEGRIESLSMDEGHVYWICGQNLYGANVETPNNFHIFVSDPNLCGYIAEHRSPFGNQNESTIVYWTDNDSSTSGLDLHWQLVVWDDDVYGVYGGRIASSKDFGGTFERDGYRLPYMAFDNSWIYYFYPEDTSIICRRDLFGHNVDEFVCYNNFGLGPLSIVDNHLFVDTLEVLDLDSLYVVPDTISQPDEISQSTLVDYAMTIADRAINQLRASYTSKDPYSWSAAEHFSEEYFDGCYPVGAIVWTLDDVESILEVMRSDFACYDWHENFVDSDALHTLNNHFAEFLMTWHIEELKNIFFQNGIIECTFQSVDSISPAIVWIIMYNSDDSSISPSVCSVAFIPDESTYGGIAYAIPICCSSPSASLAIALQYDQFSSDLSNVLLNDNKLGITEADVEDFIYYSKSDDEYIDFNLLTPALREWLTSGVYFTFQP